MLRLLDKLRLRSLFLTLALILLIFQESDPVLYRYLGYDYKHFTAISDAYLGTGNIAHPRYGGSGYVVCIEVLSLKETKNWEEFSTAVGKKWMELGGVPHLAKQYDHLPDIFEYIRQVRL